MPDWGTLAAVITGLVGIYLAVSTRRKNEGDAALSITKATQALLKPLNDKIAKQDEEIAGLRFQIEQQVLLLRQTGEELSEVRQRVVEQGKGIDLLTAQIESLGHKPVWKKPRKGANG